MHGGDVYTHFLKTGREPLDFSANVNAYGMPKSVSDSIVENVKLYENYPDINCLRLSEAVSQMEKTPRENILFGAGAADLIFRAVFTLKPKNALLFAPTFSEYEMALRQMDSNVKYVGLYPENDFLPQEDFIKNIVGKDIVFLCNPNNPTGQVVGRNYIEKVAEECRKNSAFLIVDECFLDFVENNQELTAKKLLEKYDNLLILKAFTKMFALAGLRLGYCLSSNIELLSKMKKAGPPWNVSVVAQIAGEKACLETDFMKETVKKISVEREFLVQKLTPYVKKIYTAHANFILIQSDESLADRLENKDILIRKCENFIGLDKTYYRIAVKTREENELLVRAIGSLVKGEK